MSFRTGGDRQKNKDVDFDSDVEVDSLKDAVWRLTTRVYLLEDFIAEKFGEVLGPTGYSPSVSPDNEEKSISSNKRSNVPLPPPKRNKRRRVRRIQQSNECRHIEEDQPNESDDMHNDSLGDVELSDPTTNASESFQEDENSNRDIKKEIFSDASNEVDSDDCGASPFHESRTEDCPVVKKTKGVGEDQAADSEFPYENKRVTLSFEKKLEILKELAIKTQAQVCREYSLSPSVVHRIKNSKINITQVVATGQSRRKRLKPSSHPDVDESLDIWAQTQRQLKLPINTTLLLSKANHFYKQMHPDGNWVASQGWIGRFKERHGFKFRTYKDKELTGTEKGKDISEPRESTTISKDCSVLSNLPVTFTHGNHTEKDSFI